MKIGIDGTPLTIPFHCGQRHYLEQLIFNLAKIDKKNQYFIFAPKKIEFPKQKNFSLKLMSNKFPIFKRQILLPAAAIKEKVEIFHYPDVLGSIFFKFPKIVTTLHDLAPSSAYPGWQENLKYTLLRKYNEIVRKFILNLSSTLIVDSKTIAEEASKLTNHSIPIKVIHLGLSKDFKILDTWERSNFFLAMTDFSPRKNISRVLEAHTLFLNRSNKKVPLNIVVSTSYPIENILAKAREMGMEKFINILENVSQNKLVGLYNDAICFLYPSLYEGFGLPILEAMACGCPVITSNRSATKETAGGAAYLVNPESVEEISNAMEKITNDLELAEKLKEKGLKRAKQFSWEQTARKTLKVYEKVYKNG